ncbi:Glycosyltransferase involved in cell wall bisynthesis [Pseudobutyrivibrio sp. C4]|uniref:glycosyltransferase n=1 Tax=Pseudobutyrivibrio sp. C4 TaxID=1520803 RepID=UPI0008BF201A|nr:glycosyltransferase [Pseudobutyrivibrio sp. C4]SET25765.1 Glycosyltransferase involved in cell wall bisynthesis [Pseudobutyrivibrio sp. C4]
MNKKIAFVFDGLNTGGIERVGIDYINMCIEAGYDVDVYNLKPKQNGLINQLPHDVNYYDYNLSNNGCPETYSYGVHRWWWGKYIYALISPILTIKQLFQKMIFKRKTYDVAIAFAGHINDLSFVGKNYIQSNKKICWCHGTLISYLAICDAYAMLYKYFNTIVTLSEVEQNHAYAGKEFLHHIDIKKIYNPTYILDRQLDYSKIDLLRNKYGKYILYVGRFDEGKGQDLAIEVMKLLAECGLDEKIVFAGDGHTINSVKEMAKKYGVEDNCYFLGNIGDIENYIEASYINLLTSKAEGLPTVIVEAMSFGKPCVMTNCDCGEVSNKGEYCILKDVDDASGLAEAVKRLYDDDEVYKKYSDLSFKRARAFDKNYIKAQFIKCL